MPATLTPQRGPGGEQPPKQSRRSAPGGSQPHQNVDEVDRKLPQILAKDPDLKKLVTVLSKLLMQQTQNMRDALSVLMDNFLGDGGHDLVDNGKSQGTAYNSAIEEKGKGHKLGSPHVWIFGGCLTYVVSIILEDKKKGPITPDQQVLVDFLAAYSDLSPEDKGQGIKFFKITKTYRSDVARITMALSGDLGAVRKGLVKEFERHGFGIRSGRAPASYMERDLQRWLELMV
jgi:hypothetical protein